MRKVNLPISNCRSCPHFKSSTVYTADSYERPHDWWCTLHTPDKKIAGYVEWYEEKGIEIPEWCPLPVADNTQIVRLIPLPYVDEDLIAITDPYIDLVCSGEYDLDSNHEVKQVAFDAVLKYVYGQNVFDVIATNRKK